MLKVRATANLDLGGHEAGYKWVAGATPPNDPAPGEWFVKLDKVWTVMFRSTPTGAEYPIQAFSPDDEGERAAKGMANKLVDIAWESHSSGPPHRNKIEEVLW